MNIPNNIIKSMFQNVYFITGTAYAGKSTAVKHIDKEFQPNLAYFDTMKDWQEFISRTPDEYAAWIDGCSKEAESLEIIRLFQLVAEDKKIFVDTNISLKTLREISDYQHIAVMLCPQSMSVERFFDRSDPEKRFILDQINQADNPEEAMLNYRKCLEKINSKEVYKRYADSRFYTIVRGDNSTIEKTINKLTIHFGL